LLDKIVFQQYEIKALTHNQVRIQPTTPDAYRAIIKALALPSNPKKNAPTGQSSKTCTSP
jgi:hypothetical protein